MGKFDGELGFPYTTQTNKGYTAGRLGTLSTNLVQEVAAGNKIGVAAEGDRREGFNGRLR